MPAQERMAQRAGTRSPGNRQVPALSPGDMVTHDKFGLGAVVSTDGYGDQAEAKIDFGADYGVKHLVLRYAPLEKLQGPVPERGAARRPGSGPPSPPPPEPFRPLRSSNPSGRSP